MNPIELLQVAATAGRDPRTVKAYVNGKRVSPLAAATIRRALAALDIPDPRAADGQR